MVSKAWEWQSSGSRVVKLRNKFNNIKIVARKWNREVFGRVEIDIKSKIDRLQQLQNSINSLEDIRKERQLREEIEDLIRRNLSGLKKLGLIGSSMVIETQSIFKL